MSRVVSDYIWGVFTVWCEARGESRAGKIAVARVIRNRTARRWNGAKTVAEVVLAPYQFSAWNTMDANRRAAAILDSDDPEYIECLEAWNASETDDGGVGAAVFYYNPDVVKTPPTWTITARLVAKIGRHHFFEL